MIKANKLTMNYGPVVALNEASFEVQRGELVKTLRVELEQAAVMRRLA